MPLLNYTIAPSEIALTDQSVTSIANNVVYRISGPEGTSETLKSQSVEKAEAMLLYSTKNVAAARTDDMYLRGFMCE